MDYSKERKDMSKEERLERDKLYAKNIIDSKSKMFYAFLKNNGIFYIDDIISGISRQCSVEDYIVSCLPGLKKKIVSSNSIRRQLEIMQEFSSKYFPFTRRFMISYESMDYDGFRTRDLDEIIHRNFNNYLYYANNLALEHEWLIDFVIIKIKNMNHNENLFEMKQSARYMLLAATEKYKPERNVLFSTYATNWIINAFTKERRNQMYVIGKVQRLEDELRVYSKNLFEINQKLNQRSIPLEEKKRLNDLLENLHKRFSKSMISWSLLSPMHLSEFVGEENLDTLDSLIADPMWNCYMPDGELDKEYVAEKIKEAMSKLAKQEEFVIKQTFGIGVKSKTYEEIAYRLGISKERVRQIRKRALKKLRKICIGMKLYKYIYK